MLTLPYSNQALNHQVLFTAHVIFPMTDFIIKKLPYNLSSYACLALVGQYLNRINVSAVVDPKFLVLSGVANICNLRSCLCLGKNDFDAIEGFATTLFLALAGLANRTFQPHAAATYACPSSQLV